MPDDAPAEDPPTEGPRAPARRRRGRRTRTHRQTRRDLWWFLGIAYVLFAFAWLLPQHYRVESSAYVTAAWAAFAVRAMSFQLGLFLLVPMAWAALTRHRRVTLAALPLLLVTLAWPMVQGAGSSPPPPAAHGGALRVMTANLLVGNPHHAAVAREIRAANADVVLLQEYSGAWDSYLAGRLHARYPYVRTDLRDNSFGTAIYSRKPFRDAEGDHAIALGSAETPQGRWVVRVGGRDIAIYHVHLLPPVTLAYVVEGRSEYADLVERATEDPLPVVIVGDLNVTATAPQHHDLRAHGLRDAWELAGTGRGATWPANSWRGIVMGVRLDHVYLSKELTATRIRIGDPNGSDHRPVVADIAFRRRD